MRATARGSKTSRRVQTIVQATHLPRRAHPSSSSPPRRAHSRAARSRASRARHKPRLLRVARSPSPERSLRRRRSPRRRGTRSRRRRSSLTTCRGRTRLRSHARVSRLEGVSFVRASPVRPWRMTHARARSPYLSWPIVCSCFVGGIARCCGGWLTVTRLVPFGLEQANSRNSQNIWQIPNFGVTPIAFTRTGVRCGARPNCFWRRVLPHTVTTDQSERRQKNLTKCK